MAEQNGRTEWPNRRGESAAPQTPMNELIMNETNENQAAPPVDVPRLVRQVVVERVTTKREEIPVTACLPHEAFEKAKSEGEVLTESETVEYIIKDYPEDY